MSGRHEKTNVLIVASSLWIGGAETVIRHLAQAIDRSRFNVTVCCLKQLGTIGRELVSAGVDVVGIAEGEEPRVDYFTSRKLLKVIRAKDIDVVHTHTTHGLVDASICKLMISRLKHVHTFHFGNYPHIEGRVIWMERVCSRLADRLLAVGEVQRRQVASVHHLRDRRIDTIWNGVHLPGGEGDPSFRRRLGADRSLLVGTVATLIEQKGLRDLLAVAKRVRDTGRDVRFVVVGEGRLRGELEALRHGLGLDETVTITGWIADAAEKVLPILDVFLQPSLWEAMSVVLLEAMAAGKPVVATRVGETPYVVDDGVDGLLVDPGDVDGMAGALCRLVDDAGLRQRLGSAGRSKVRQRFTVDHMTRAYERVYLQLAQ